MVSRFARLVLLVLMGVVLLPPRAVAATLPALIAYDGAVGATATVTVEAGPSLRPERGRATEYVYDAVHVGYDGAANPQVVHGVGAVHAYDRALDPTERREVTEGAIYDAPFATLAAEGVALKRFSRTWNAEAAV
jgi:hypothetical protein